ncbi:MAG: hypothetical protein A2568_03245 [Candidatus Yanofskybacteria bacterium RIFOXYD1_FULL_44_17]|nr:MAG: hypothetical protein A2207_02825 [Candidatus Yanofskybacteria bacterium RIFOXYA1_FULL_44_17]OGN36430.1 MAG: hypothetical protein A2241_01660 [Candidatus Yanofskybacteria bacterium RIFOXYA2_FULL_45_28]OGN37903.1 MAG: hypothetical protein A2405_00200 [Candidatus Yanofskybacteria bacterium RIFOXYC1_FULL_44_16]OGN39591.1 MAG: hypothetical protein A2568_03245 [Candidatus Yanofskybacteria bacterium RIFOXYD1_FULL_44_17]
MSVYNVVQQAEALLHPEEGFAMWDPYAELKKFQLPNGLTVYLGTWDRPWLKVGIVVHSGARQDVDGKEGTAHFVEHLVGENVRPWTNETIKRYFQESGGKASLGSTGYNATSFHFDMPLEGDNLERALDLFGHMLVDCKIEHMVERERQVIIQEFARRFPIRWMADRVLRRRQLLFPGVKLARSPGWVGTPESILRITAEDMQSFYDQYYTPANMTIVAVGGLKPEEFAAILSKSPFGFEKSGIRTPLVKLIDHFNPPEENMLIHKISDYSLQAADRSAIESFVAMPGTVRRKALARVSDVLGDVFFREIREKRGWTYGFSSGWEDFGEAYEFNIQGAFPWNGLEAIEGLVDDCLAMAEKNDDLIQHHIKASVLGYKIIDVSGSKVVDGSVGDLKFHHRVLSNEEEARVSAAVTVEEVKSIFPLLARDRRWTVIIHP